MTLNEFYEQWKCDEKERHELRDYLAYLRLLATIRMPIEMPKATEESHAH